MSAATEVRPGGGEPSAGRRGAAAPARRRRPAGTYLMLVAAIVALVAANGLADGGFLSTGQLRNTLLVAAPLALLAGGQTLCMLIGGIDLSVAMTATAAAYVTGSRSAAGDPPAVAVAAGLAVGLLVGVVNGVGVAVFRVNALIITLGMAGVLTGVLTVGSQSFLGGATRIPGIIRALGSGTEFGPVPWNVLLWAVTAAVLLLVLRGTGFGRLVYAVGDNRIACRLAGIRVWRVELLVHVGCSLLAAMAGLLLAGRSGAVDLQLANGLLLPSVAAAVIGGTSILGGSGGYGGTILGAVILTLLDTLLTRLNVGEALRQVLSGAILLGLGWSYVAGAVGSRRPGRRAEPQISASGATEPESESAQTPASGEAV